ncbi:hypothetical protein DY000_02028917 [Brassica cretica]|uniref:Uncharacterized protein n=1 Tax=Brassica cretica TaxID=69181 RepID=A0ABQ7DZK2_BRACR|nr:hypothetical protein DY000_02028917 [Brassica cretica]
MLKSLKPRAVDSYQLIMESLSVNSMPLPPWTSCAIQMVFTAQETSQSNQSRRSWNVLTRVAHTV